MFEFCIHWNISDQIIVEARSTIDCFYRCHSQHGCYLAPWPQSLCFSRWRFQVSGSSCHRCTVSPGIHPVRDSVHVGNGHTDDPVVQAPDLLEARYVPSKNSNLCCAFGRTHVSSTRFLQFDQIDSLKLMPSEQRDTISERSKCRRWDWKESHNQNLQLCRRTKFSASYPQSIATCCLTCCCWAKVDIPVGVAPITPDLNGNFNPFWYNCKRLTVCPKVVETNGRLLIRATLGLQVHIHQTYFGLTLLQSNLVSHLHHF